MSVSAAGAARRAIPDLEARLVSLRAEIATLAAEADATATAAAAAGGGSPLAPRVAALVLLAQEARHREDGVERRLDVVPRDALHFLAHTDRAAQRLRDVVELLDAHARLPPCGEGACRVGRRVVGARQADLVPADMAVELREREAYEKPTTKRKRLKNLAKRRWQKRQESLALPAKDY